MKNLFTLGPGKHGAGPVTFAWHPGGTFLATSGSNKVVHIADRKGDIVDQINLSANGTGPCLDLRWDSDGEMLAILQGGTGSVSLWESASRKTTQIDTGMKDLTLVRWSPSGPHLAVGTAKGNLLLFDKRTLRKVPVLGAHSKRISCGAWSRDGRLALGGEDRQVTISSHDGNLIDNLLLKQEPVSVEFCSIKTDDRAAAKGDATVCVNMAGKSVLLYTPGEGAKPTELAFQTKYNKITEIRSFGDGYMLVGFESGFFVVISTHTKEIGQEIFSAQLFPDTGLRSIAFSPAIQRAAACGDDTVRVLDVASGWSEVVDDKITLEDEHGRLDKVEWSSDGQILAVATRNGNVHCYLARIPNLTARCGSSLLYLSSLREVAVCPVAGGKAGAASHRVEIGMEPSFVGLGPRHVVVGGNNNAWMYRIGGRSSEASVREYLGSVEAISLNSSRAAALSRGVVQLHPIEGDGPTVTYPDSDTRDASCLALTEDFLIYGTRGGVLRYEPLPAAADEEDPQQAQAPNVAEHRHATGIARVFPNASGTRCVAIDDAHSAFIFAASAGTAIEVPSLPAGVSNVLWDVDGSDMFVACGTSRAVTYAFAPVSVDGSTVDRVGESPIPAKATPAAVQGGSLICQSVGGGLVSVPLHTHSSLTTRGTPAQGAAAADAVAQLTALLRLEDAWGLTSRMRATAKVVAPPSSSKTSGDAAQREAERLQEVQKLGKETAVLVKLGDAALRLLNVDVAARVYRRLGDIARVLELERLERIEDVHLLAGNVALLRGDPKLAQDHFLASSEPMQALHMRRDLLDWEPALQLAHTLEPLETPFIGRQFAKQLEHEGEHKRSLEHYENSRIAEADFDRYGDGGTDPYTGSRRDVAAHNAACDAGIARVALRLGDIRRGVDLARKSGSRQLARECAQILESMKQLPEAASLFEAAELWDRAGAIYISLKNFMAVKPLMDTGKITTPKLYVQYARAKEAEGSFPDASAAYERAGDLTSVVRLSLEKLNAHEAAFALVRRTRSVDGAALIARFCLASSNFRGAIEFLLLAGQKEDALEVAKRNDLVQLYAEFVKDDGSVEQFRRIAEWFEGQARPGEAGLFYAKCGDPHRAVRLFLQGSADDEKYVQEAIDVVGSAGDEVLTHHLIDYLTGETDGVHKDPKWIFRLYMALGKFAQAARTAVAIAGQEQELGNYKQGRDLLFETHRDLTANNVPVPADLDAALCLLHSYVMVKPIIVIGEHLVAARLLLRVARSISKFPSHIVQILTTTVIETRRAGLKRSAFEYASMLMRPEHRGQIKPEFLKNIDHIARKPVRTEEEEPTSPCPFCDHPVAETKLDCPNCLNRIPYCSVTVRHMRLDDWSSCPSCGFVALYSAMVPYLENEKASKGKCPMCSAMIRGKVVQTSPVEARASLLKPAEDEGGADEGDK